MGLGFYRMPMLDLKVTNGPDKADLVRAVTKVPLHLPFHLRGDVVDAEVAAIQEHGDGVAVTLQGQLVCGIYKGSPFVATYNPRRL